MKEDREFFAQVPSASIADAATALGMNLVVEGVRPVDPAGFPHVAGPAATFVFAPVNVPGTPPYTLYEVVESLPAGSVVVVAAAGAPWAAWGENATRCALRRGAVGAVIDGATRDVEAICGSNFPVWSRSVWSLSFARKLEVVARDVPVQCGGVRVEPGDIVVADVDGVAVVPQSHRGAVRRQVEKILAVDKEVAERFQRGESMVDLYRVVQKKFVVE